MLIELAEMVLKNTHILFGQFFVRFANSYKANHNENPDCVSDARCYKPSSAREGLVSPASNPGRPSDVNGGR